MKYTKLDFSIKDAIKPPYFMGSQLRGVFGYALKNIVCVNPSYKCDSCFASQDCLFYDFFERKNTYHKYRFDIELARDCYDFSFYLFEESCEKLPYIISSLYNSLTKIGLGKNNKIIKDFKIYLNNQVIYENDSISLPKKYHTFFEVEPVSTKNIVIDILTPIRIKKNKKLVFDDSLELEDILLSIYKRYITITNQKFKKIDLQKDYKVISKNITAKRLTRLNSVKKETMRIDGVIGNFVIKDINTETYRLLKLGELLGVGKQTVFGLGKIEIKEI
ncbi:MAG: CRISPR system precrRNA processing endoribonuclease RAMP protein Cas6 [Campylobacterota bacterium]